MNDQVVRALAHPMRHRMLFEYAHRVSSPSKVAARLREPVNIVSYHTRVLVDMGYLELVRTERRRGATEHFYRASTVGEITDEEWSRLPVRRRRAIARQTLHIVWQDVREALPCGGMDEPSTHLSHVFLQLDDQGRAELAALLRATVAKAQQIEAASGARGQEDHSSVELAVLGFRCFSAP